MPDLQVKSLDTKYVADYESWFDSRASTNILFKESKHSGLASPYSHAWTGSLDGEIVAVAILSVDEMRHNHLEFAVKPSERRQGIGSEMMSQVIAEPVITDALYTQVAVDPGNTAGQKILRHGGFAQTGYNPDGLLEFKKQ